MALNTSGLNKQFFFSGLAVVLVMLSVYARTGGFEFVWDDSVLLWNGSYYRGENLFDAIWSHFPVSENYFRPLVVATFVTDMALFDNAPGPMHLHNVLFHTGSTLLVGALTAQMLHRWRSLESVVFPLLAALSFGLSPMLVEPVAWVSGRFDVYVTFWLLLLINMDLLLRDLKWRVATAYVLFIMAALSKEMAATFPLVYLFIRMMLLQEQGSMNLRMRALSQDGVFYVFGALVAAGCTYLAMRLSVLGYLNRNPADDLLFQHFGTVLQHILLVGKTAGTYLLYAFAGAVFTSPVHYHQFPVEYSDVGAWIGLAVFLCVLSGSGFMIVRGVRAGYVLPVFFIALLPVLNIVFWPNTEDLVQERFLSLPLALLMAMLMAVIAERFAQHPERNREKKMSLFLLTAWIIVSAVITITCVPIWKNHLTLWTWAVYRSPQSSYANVNLSSAYRQMGDLVNASKYAEIANKLDPERSPGNLNLVAIATANKEYQRALSIIDKEIATQNAAGKLEETEFNYMKAMALHGLGQLDEPVAILEDLLRKDTKDGNSAMLLGLILQEKGEMQRANACWVMAIRQMPASEAAKLFSDGVVHEDILLQAAQGKACL